MIKMEAMIDIETLNVEVNSVIIAISAIKFNRYSKPKKLEELDNSEIFFRKIDEKSCLDLGLEKDLKTIEWWKNQDKSVFDELFSEKDKISISDALNELKIWLNETEIIWCHGVSFDIPILENAFKKCKITIPWKYWNVRDTRTIFDVAQIQKYELPSQSKHHPTFDCWRQIVGVKKAFEKLKSFLLK